MKMEELKINIEETFGRKLVLASPPVAKYRYKDNIPTDEIEAYSYDVVCLDRGYKHIDVKVKGPVLQIAVGMSVVIENLEFYAYVHEKNLLLAYVLPVSRPLAKEMQPNNGCIGATGLAGP